jgi:hypothetical protein
VNLLFYDFETRFYHDAKRAELSLAGMRVLGKRLGAGLAGSFLAKLRLLVCVLPALGLLLPHFQVDLRFPFAQKTFSAGLLGLPELLQPGVIPFFLSAQGAQDAAFSGFFTAMNAVWVCLGFCALCALLVLLLSLLSFTAYKKMSRAVAAFSFLGAVCATAGFVLSLYLLRTPLLGNRDFVGGLSLFWGGIPASLIFIAVGVVNLLFAKSTLKIVYAAGDAERAAIWKRVKKGAARLEDLPFPVVETAETRAQEAALRGGDANPRDTREEVDGNA